MPVEIDLRNVTADNWRACADLQVGEAEGMFVSPITRYLCLCHYGRVWSPLAVHADGTLVGFAMWAVDPDDRSGWIGGLVIDERHRRHGYGRAAIEALVARLQREQGCTSFALTYAPENTAARALYLGMGFVETGEMEDDEVVARLTAA